MITRYKPVLRLISSTSIHYEHNLFQHEVHTTCTTLLPTCCMYRVGDTRSHTTLNWDVLIVHISSSVYLNTSTAQITSLVYSWTHLSTCINTFTCYRYNFKIIGVLSVWVHFFLYKKMKYLISDKIFELRGFPWVQKWGFCPILLSGSKVSLF